MVSCLSKGCLCFRRVRVRLPVLGRHQRRGQGLHPGSDVRRRREEADVRGGAGAQVVGGWRGFEDLCRLVLFNDASRLN